jgi:hypothetical protein
MTSACLAFPFVLALKGRLRPPSPLDVPAFVDAALSAGYKGPWGVEILSETFRRLPLVEMATRAFEATMRQFSRPAR